MSQRFVGPDWRVTSMIREMLALFSAAEVTKPARRECLDSRSTSTPAAFAYRFTIKATDYEVRASAVRWSARLIRRKRSAPIRRLEPLPEPVSGPEYLSIQHGHRLAFRLPGPV